MRHPIVFRFCTLAVGLSLFAGGASAATFIDDFDGSTENWAVTSEPVAGSEAAVLSAVDLDGDSDTDLRIYAATPGGGATDRIYAPVGGAGTALNDATGGEGDLTTVDFGYGDEATARVTFDFWSNADAGGGGDNEAAALEFYFVSGGSYWRYGIDQTMVDGIMNAVSISLYESLFYHTGSAGTFAAALASVDEIGIMITYQGFTGQEYGIDNFELHNPEPGTYAVLAFALMSLGVTFRGKLRTGLKGLLSK
ncbi:MAG: hypothetical protein HQ523_15795 [Lentisphaerae bacterium]|nr:hypothetical protein [Lentisphaerota bacterium]